MSEPPSSESSPKAHALTALDFLLGEVVLVMVPVEMAAVELQVSIAAVVSMAAPGGRGQEVGQGAETRGALADSGRWQRLPQRRTWAPLEESRPAGFRPCSWSC